MEQIAKKLTQYFLAHGLIKEDDAEVCQYALYRHISRAVGLIALTLLGGLITDFGLAFCPTVCKCCCMVSFMSGFLLIYKDLLYAKTGCGHHKGNCDRKFRQRNGAGEKVAMDAQQGKQNSVQKQ